jgi:hypothetical protein
VRPATRDQLERKIDMLTRELTAARAEIAALKFARGVAVRVGTWGARRTYLNVQRGGLRESRRRVGEIRSRL